MTKPQPQKIMLAIPNKHPVQTRIGQTLRRHRRAAGLTLEAAGSRAGIRMANMSLIERGLVDPRISTLARIAEALRVPLGEILLEAE